MNRNLIAILGLLLGILILYYFGSFADCYIGARFDRVGFFISPGSIASDCVRRVFLWGF